MINTSEPELSDPRPLGGPTHTIRPFFVFHSFCLALELGFPLWSPSKDVNDSELEKHIIPT
ncbi:hypothetical protein K435DRAFT_496992 [Dendrothele bispora CBS 962.96]|uniref:Uncharacterized protein n=1 Tax=Dendrothele bispora (strain CBS 962.96) TaxID=1314807 RepID=A0A4S8KX11_DENBC|nr:hypothetical protein K435DRAFT_496992 [Dendrothele bispora CBS 962.96]